MGIFSTNFLNMQPGLTSFSPRVSIPPFCVHNYIFSIILGSLHIIQRLCYLKLQSGLIVISHCGLICRNLLVRGLDCDVAISLESEFLRKVVDGVAISPEGC